jgi:hypothetical protein
MKTLIFFIVILLAASILHANTIIVDINGAGQFTTIQAGINAAAAGDTVQVWPGTYTGQVNLNKSILLCGSGYENTVITGSYNPCVWIASSGKIQWFTITSLSGAGCTIAADGSIIRNCVIKSCATYGIYNQGYSGYVYNTLIINNGSYGIIMNSNTSTMIVMNCIARNNTSTDYYANYQSCCTGYSTIMLSYSDGSYANSNYGYVSGLQGVINADPLFISTTNSDYHIPSGSPCYNTGNPSLTDPDGSRSDMGYFGGPWAPTYPVVYEMTIAPNGSTINVQAKARANY